MKTCVKAIISACGLMLAAACAGCAGMHDEPATRIGAGDRLPLFEVEMSDGRCVGTASLAGKSGAIVFFNTSCADCRAELPRVQAAYDELAPQGVEIVCVSRAEASESVAAYWAATGLTMPYAACSDRTVYELFAVSGIPRVYVFDAGGRITGTSLDDLRLVK